MLKRFALSLVAPGLLVVPLAGCVHHPHHVVEERVVEEPVPVGQVVTYRVEEAPPPPPPPVREVIIERERPYPGAVWIRGEWVLDRSHHRWVWHRGAGIDPTGERRRESRGRKV